MKQHAFLIRIPKKKDRIRAIEVLFDVPFPRHGFPGHKWLVMTPHIVALQQAGIPFEDITDPADDHNGKAGGDGKKQAREPKRRAAK